ncbi:hypothetical protein CPB86DRAFT_527252 [Serendipita vermifera]|nr:hypothetical protein CPB86DRAFT_527252 [Serendipita vermifera]
MLPVLQTRDVDQAALEEIARDLALTNWSSGIALTIICYDTFLTLGEEVRLLWPKKWGVIKVFIYLDRLITFPFLIVWALTYGGVIKYTDNTCNMLFTASSFGAFLFFLMSNWIMLTRTASLFGNSRKFKIWMTAFYVATYLATGALITVSMLTLRHPGHIFFAEEFNACAIAFRPWSYGYIWIPALLFETVICIQTVLKVHKKVFGTYRLGSKLFLVLFRDGVGYYVIIVALRAYNMFAWMTMPPARLFTGFLCALSSLPSGIGAKN